MKDLSPTARGKLSQPRRATVATGLALLAMAACGGQNKQSEPPGEPLREAVTMEAIAPLRDHLLVPAMELSDAQRAQLTRRMQSHGKVASDLLTAVLLLDWTGAARIAVYLAKEPEEEKELREVFPETFFDLEAMMRTHATALAGAAQASRSEETVQHYTSLVATCVECHTLFTRRVPTSRGPDAAKTD